VLAAAGLLDHVGAAARLRPGVSCVPRALRIPLGPARSSGIRSARGAPRLGRPTGAGVVATARRVAGRSVKVTTEHGRALTFVLNRATATFTGDGGQTGLRLRFEQALD
jgi:hypothetical protein